MINDNITFSGIIVALLCVLLIVSKKTKTHSDYYLILWMIISGSNLAYYLLPSNTVNVLQIFGFTLPVFSTAILYLYVISITFNIPFSFKVILKHSLFYIFYNLVFLSISFGYDRINFINNIPYLGAERNSFLLNLLTLPMAIIPVIYIVLCFLALKKYQKILPENYSTLDKINLNWLKWIVISLIFIFLIVIAIISSGTRFDIIRTQDIFSLVSNIQSIYIICIVYFSLRQSIVINQNISLIKIDKIKEKPFTTDDKAIAISEQLLAYMTKEKPYLDESLSLTKLSSLINISTNQLSQIINQTLNTNFYQFVNSYRVEEVKEKLKEPKYSHYSILGVAYECGFNTKSTFNKIFKEQTGMTPSEYRGLNK
ncbi:helix-turn-helix domain-containing protein [Chryseobacterium sp. FH1]|uniref:helix-turn-helix domain-containing protein n=1 Tax=Chryseobacterium sp. FH1 TaxID=1233951 RepID=UPI0004E3BEBC|nr:helix-turn-helix domain-containing protein [Chryseobacterium sp. FH1]KFC19275.1 hypothetical protein IO90_08160 [Chryseobacterium sp. FH1]